jgi:hypothetical protein
MKEKKRKSGSGCSNTFREADGIEGEKKGFKKRVRRKFQMSQVDVERQCDFNVGNEVVMVVVLLEWSRSWRKWSIIRRRERCC